METTTIGTTRRFRFWNVFWVVLALFIFLFIFGLMAASINPIAKAELDKHDFLALKNIISQVVSFTFTVVYYYLTLNLFYKLMAQKRPFIDYLKRSVIIVIVLLVYYSLSYLGFDDREIKSKITIPLMVFSYFISTAFYLGLSILIAYLVYLRDEKKQNKILEEQKMQLELEKSAANFNFLKAQINPHFLHNTLNFLYAKSLPYSEELSEGILTLSDIMRYALSEGNARDGKAPLKDEIEHMQNVIKINQLRFSNQLNVQFEVDGKVNGQMIIPFVLITLVENAFKHGDLKNTAYPISIRLSVEEKTLAFYCSNKKKTGPKELSTGIGLDNIRKRLELAYGNNFTYNVKDEDGYYSTELIITAL